MKKIFAGFIGAALLSSSLGCSNSNVRASIGPPPAKVEVAPTIQKDVSIQGEWVGTLEGYVNAQISPQVSGYLIRQDYREGALVKKGQVLFEIDPRPFQAVLDQAKAQLAQAQAQVLYQNGGASYLQVLTNETNYFSAELNLVQAQLNERLALVQLYQALGGGWQQ
jgi:membrane fusion protein, multidrug efflux system